MYVEIRREDRRSLAAYATVPIAFAVSAVVDATRLRLGEADLSFRPAGPPRVKNYDAYIGNGPLSWANRFSMDTWVFLAAYDEHGERIGGAVVISDAAAIAEIGGRPSHAVLWDLRVTPLARRRGVGRALLTAADKVARAADCCGLDAETQDINAAACLLYAAGEFILTAIAPASYPEAATETKLVWTKLFALG